MSRSLEFTRPLALAVALAVAPLGGAACSSSAPPRPETGGDPLPAPGPATPRALAATLAGAVEFRLYDGAHAADARLVGLRNRLVASVADAVAAAEERAGVTFLPGRDAAVVLADEGAGFMGSVTVRLLDGVRRPVIRVPVDHLLAGTFVPEVHFPSLVVEAAVLASAGDRAAPSWLRTGLAVEIAGTFERVLHERALGGVDVRTDATALFPPTPSGDDPLRAAARVRALDRIARGDRALARYVVLRLEGRPEDVALAEVGVQDALFLDAAAETERDRALDALAGLGLDELAAVRAALSAGESARAVAPAALLETDLRDGRLNRFLAADARVALADFLEERGDAAGAQKLIAAALADPAHLVRVRHARLVEARAAVGAGAARQAATLFRAYASDFPGAPGADEALEALGVPAELAEALPGVAAQITSEDPSVRQRAAVRLGETGDALAAEPLRELTRDEDADVRRLAYAALALAVGEDAVDDLDRGTRDASPDVRGAALSLLAFADPDRGATRAGELEDDAAPAVRAVVDRILAPVREADARRVAAEAAAAKADREAAAKLVAEAEEQRLRDVAEKARRRAAEDATQRAAERAAAERAAAERGVPPRPVSPPVVTPPRPVPPRPVTPPVPPPVKSVDPPLPVPPVPPRPSGTGGSSERPLPPPQPPRPLPAPETDRPDPTRKPPPPKPPARGSDPVREKPSPPARSDDSRS